VGPCTLRDTPKTVLAAP